MKGIIFQGDSVRSILSDIKTETRRVCKNVSIDDWDKNDKSYGPFTQDQYGDHHKTASYCPYGAVGTELYVKETFCAANIKWDTCDKICYRASVKGCRHANYQKDWPSWRSPLFMPESASRLHIILTAIDVQRVQEITEEEAKAEGVEIDPCDHIRYSCKDIGCRGPYGAPYSLLWNTINAIPKPKYKNKTLQYYTSYPWCTEDRDPRTTIRGVPHHCYPNPWVYALKFTKVLKS